MRVWPVLVLAILGAASVARPAAETPADTITNLTCPVMVGTRVDPAIWVDYRGERIYFCCERCVQRFQQDPEFYLANVNLDPESVAGDDLYPEWEGGEFPRRLLRFLGHLHPVTVHFPIAFSLGALMADALYLAFRRDRCRHAARFLLLLGGLSVLAVVPLGYAAAAGVTYPPETAANLGWHRLLGTTGGALLLAAALLREWGRLGAGPAAVHASRAVLLVATVSIALAGYHGGVLIYGHGHFAW